MEIPKQNKFSQNFKICVSNKLKLVCLFSASFAAQVCIAITRDKKSPKLEMKIKRKMQETLNLYKKRTFHK